MAIPELTGRGALLRGRDPATDGQHRRADASAIAKPQVNRLKFMISRLSRLVKTQRSTTTPQVMKRRYA
jgi:hypothetical protein